MKALTNAPKILLTAAVMALALGACKKTEPTSSTTTTTTEQPAVTTPSTTSGTSGATGETSAPATGTKTTQMPR